MNVFNPQIGQVKLFMSKQCEIGLPQSTWQGDRPHGPQLKTCGGDAQVAPIGHSKHVE